ncbi:MAG: hypothetical protein PHD51_00280 [Patescibacteria group bacterium]|nr:hypothetical protein [Patescibacteria group bacterium]MDD5490694.1 hypothetical protein [Patescibacteria group bacterium]
MHREEKGGRFYGLAIQIFGEEAVEDLGKTRKRMEGFSVRFSEAIKDGMDKIRAARFKMNEAAHFRFTR